MRANTCPEYGVDPNTQITRGWKGKGLKWIYDPNWTVDWKKGKGQYEPYPYYPFHDYYDVGTASISDQPGATNPFYLHKYWQEFETCAYSIHAPKGNPLGCVRWGHAFKTFGRAWDYGSGNNQTALPPTWDFQQLMQGMRFP